MWKLVVDRRQEVDIRGKNSEGISGVPEGSEGEPLLSLIYLDDIDEGMLWKLWIFGGDTKLQWNWQWVRCKYIAEESKKTCLVVDSRQGCILIVHFIS